MAIENIIPAETGIKTRRIVYFVGYAGIRFIELPSGGEKDSGSTLKVERG
ncbi:hypothetical protein ES705_26644 [subsurface metagenome]